MVQRVNPYEEGHPIKQEITEAKDTNSCTVVALSCVTGNSWKACDGYLRKYGRRYRKGMLRKQQEEAFKGLTKFVTKESPYNSSNRITIGQFLKKHPKGKFYCCVRGHAFAIIDGVLYDHSERLRRQITFAYRFYTLEEVANLRREV